MILKASIFAMAACTAMASYCQGSYSHLFGSLWMVVGFTYSSTAGATGKLLQQHYPKTELASKISIIAAASRFGSLASSILFGVVLAMGLSWRAVFRTAAALQVFVLLYYTYGAGVLSQARSREPIHTGGEFSPSTEAATRTLTSSSATTKSTHNLVSSSLRGGSTSSLSPSTQTESIPYMLRRLLTDGKFLTMLAAKVLLMVVAKFISFIPMYLITALKMKPSAAATSSAVFAVSVSILNRY